MAKLAPESMVYNIMPVFTFMGSNVVQRDDSYSFRVVQKVGPAAGCFVVRADPFLDARDDRAGDGHVAQIYEREWGGAASRFALSSMRVSLILTLLRSCPAVAEILDRCRGAYPPSPSDNVRVRGQTCSARLIPVAQVLHAARAKSRTGRFPGTCLSATRGYAHQESCAADGRGLA